MCFSAAASFTASAVLGALGALAIQRVKNPAYYLFASVPLFFGIQQACEGYVWLTGSRVAGLIFLFFALVVWPTVIPCALMLIERTVLIRDYLYFFCIAGAVLSAYLLLSICIAVPDVSAQGCHIIYTIYPLDIIPRSICAIAYCLVTLVPFFLSSRPHMELLGILLALSCLTSYLFFTIYFTSVWCFFAALISAAVVVLVDHE